MENIITYKSMAKSQNDRKLNDWFRRLMLISRSVFEWVGLEELGIDEKHIEKYLFAEGKCVFFKDPILGLMVARMTPNGPINYYDEPTIIRPYATNYTGEELENGINCVVIKNNDDMYPTSPTIQLYAMELTDIDRTIDVNIKAQKMPIIIKCTDKQRLSLKRFIDQRNDNEPVIFADKTLDTDGIEVLNTTAPIVFPELELQKHMIYNECMTFLGINNANQDKKERLVTDEVQVNNEQVLANFNVMLRARERACSEINRIFGTNISVRKRIQTTPIMNESEEGSEGEVEVC